MCEFSTEDAIEGCRSMEDDKVFFNPCRQIIRRSPGGKTVEGAVGRASKCQQLIFRKSKRELICVYKKRSSVE